MQPFVVTEDRAQKAIDIIRAKTVKLGETKTLMILAEIGLYEFARYDASMNLDFQMTDLQLVCAAAALVAVDEAGGYVSL